MPEGTVDGRRERTEVTHRRILDAARELVLAGNFEPTAKEIAARAGVTARTLFRHFPDMEFLHREIMLDAQSQAQAVMDEPFPVDLSATDEWQEQMSIVVERRARVYEYLLPLHISSVLQRYRSSITEQTMRQGVARRRKRLREILPAELASDTLLFEAMDAILSIEFWVSLRQDQQLSVARATRVLHRAVGRMTAQ